MDVFYLLLISFSKSVHLDSNVYSASKFVLNTCRSNTFEQGPVTRLSVARLTIVDILD